MNTAFACTKVARPSEFFAKPHPFKPMHGGRRYNRSVTRHNVLMGRRCDDRVRPYERAVFIAAVAIVKNDADAEEVA